VFPGRRFYPGGPGPGAGTDGLRPLP